MLLFANLSKFLTIVMLFGFHCKWWLLLENTALSFSKTLQLCYFLYSENHKVFTFILNILWFVWLIEFHFVFIYLVLFPDLKQRLVMLLGLSLYSLHWQADIELMTSLLSQLPKYWNFKSPSRCPALYLILHTLSISFFSMAWAKFFF